MELVLQPVSVSHLCDSSLTFVKQQANQKNIQIKSNVPKEISEVIVDERRMRQLLINLLNNAVKFTPNGGHVILEVEADNQAETIIFRVRDTGIGIAPEDIGKLFQAFVQVDSSLTRNYSGTGLGLALVRRIAELHGGSVTLESEVGKGSSFTVILPLNGDLNNIRSEEKTAAIDLVVLPESVSNSSAPKILIAEDNDENIDTLMAYFLNHGYQFILAKNGLEAVELAKSEKPQLILMDIAMPKMDGLTAIRKIREDPALSHVPIIALTALAMSGDREKCLAAGANEYLTKPVSGKMLLNLIQHFLKY